MNSTLFAVEADGSVVAHMIYDPWGNPLLETYTDTNYSGLDNLNNFTGYTWDETLGLYFAQNRFYDATTHRFTQEDALRDGGNWYVYCGNDPLNYVDSLGLFNQSARITEGATGDDVKLLQRALVYLGYSVGSAGIDGSFGPATLQAVNSFKDAYLPGGNVGKHRGVVGFDTWNVLIDAVLEKGTGGYFPRLLCEDLTEGIDSDTVKILQTALTMLNYSVGPAGIDGSFGPDTLSAVNAFKDHYLPGGNVDPWRGIVGNSTWEILRTLLFQAIVEGQIGATPVTSAAPSDAQITNVAANGSIQAFLDVALSMVGTERGSDVHKAIAKSAGLGTSASWCAAFVSYCAKQAEVTDTVFTFTSCVGQEKNVPLSTGIGKYVNANRFVFVRNPYNYPSATDADTQCRICYDNYLAKGNVVNATYEPTGGDVVFFRWNTGSYKGNFHVGIVYCLDLKNPEYIWTVEGNTSGANGYDTNFGKLTDYSTSMVAVKHRRRIGEGVDIIGYGVN